MELAGITIDRLAVLELAERLGHARHSETAALLLMADAVGDERVALNISDREAIIDVLGDRPDALAELYEVLVLEHMGRSLGQMA
jgi:hypothetical protein